MNQFWVSSKWCFQNITQGFAFHIDFYVFTLMVCSLLSLACSNWIDSSDRQEWLSSSKNSFRENISFFCFPDEIWDWDDTCFNKKAGAWSFWQSPVNLIWIYVNQGSCRASGAPDNCHLAFPHLLLDHHTAFTKLLMSLYHYALIC